LNGRTQPVKLVKLVKPVKLNKMARKVISRSEIIIMVIIGLVLLTLGLDKCGVDVIKKSEDSEIIERPHG
jgi:hypothetical protein